MNELKELINEYGGGTGNCLVYYDFQNTGEEGVYNTIPSRNMGRFTGVPVLGSSISEMYVNSVSGVDIAIDYLKFGSFDYETVNPNNLKTQLTFLFSFKKTKPQAGVLFGSLVNDEISLGGRTFEIGRGFNIGVTSRNKLFFQGISEKNGPALFVAEQLELANWNICGVAVAPNFVVFSLFDLDSDRHQEQMISTRYIVNGNVSGESYYIGGSPTFYQTGHSFSGYINNFLMLSGVHDSSNLKSIASGFICSGEQISGGMVQRTIITGYSNQILYEAGVTGIESYVTGTRILKRGNFIEFVLQSSGAFLSDGDRFLTGYLTPDGEPYLEETSFLIPNPHYLTTGDCAHSTLGLQDSTQIVTRYNLVSSRSAGVTGAVNLYGFRPMTGLVPTGSISTPLYKTIEIPRSDLDVDYSILPEYSGLYQHDYLYYLAERI